MEQSKTYPLQLSLDFSDTSFDDPGADIAQALPSINTLMQNLTRWESLNVGMSTTFHPFRTLAPVRGHLPSLSVDAGTELLASFATFFDAVKPPTDRFV